MRVNAACEHRDRPFNSNYRFQLQMPPDVQGQS
jgi:hypothetical protein